MEVHSNMLPSYKRSSAGIDICLVNKRLQFSFIGGSSHPDSAPIRTCQMDEKAMTMQSPSSNMKVFNPIPKQPATTFTSYPLQQILEQQDKSYAQPMPPLPAPATGSAAVANQYQAECVYFFSL